MKIGLPYLPQVQGNAQTTGLDGTGAPARANAPDDDTPDQPSDTTHSNTLNQRCGWIAQTFRQLVAGLTAGYHTEHNTDDTHSSNITLDGTPLGKWTSVNVAQAGVTGSGAMTIASVTITTLRYTILNRLMIVTFFIAGTVGGTPDTYIILTVPNAKATASIMYAACTVFDNATYQSGYCFTDPTIPRQIRIIKQNQAVWTAGAVSVWGQIAFEITG